MLQGSGCKSSMILIREMPLLDTSAFILFEEDMHVAFPIVPDIRGQFLGAASD